LITRGVLISAAIEDIGAAAADQIVVAASPWRSSTPGVPVNVSLAFVPVKLGISIP